MTTIYKPYFSKYGIVLPNSTITDSKTLDWYEEGEVTTGLTVTGSVSNPTSVSYTTRSFKYQRVGNILHFKLVLYATFTGGSGDIILNGLPYAPVLITSGTSFEGRLPAIFQPDGSAGMGGPYIQSLLLANGVTTMRFVSTNYSNIQIADTSGFGGVIQAVSSGSYFVS